ncbi:LytR/AlgR family response regulator transcription factor [Acetobacteroides hydrogenigenes]|uniref:Two-component system LytT family response regulator n=1 Tax=Acetobacteroides hydrogenigenes TaxID=979970 RepID=A0A4R2EBG7_9BACT|nr:response regulator [Acetobacteroides hydrogenigenes]TCN65683.1 two-component system LytT family response regulator [Acetobacteroides hydrogenigenes]
MDAIKAIIVDDERAAVESLSIMLEKYCDDLSVVATALSVSEAKREIVRYMPDVVFLDIMMPEGSGFDILEELPDRSFDIVFVTAYNDLAIKALKYCAIDFIQKPVCKDELTKAIEKVKNNKGIVRNSSLQYAVLFENLGNELPQKLCLTTPSGVEVVDIEQVIAFEAVEDGVVAHILNGRTVESDKGIDDLEDTVIDNLFFRVTNELLLNLKNVEIISKNEIFMRGGLCFKVPTDRIGDIKIRYGNPPY